jgi:hypothetical protein
MNAPMAESNIATAWNSISGRRLALVRSVDGSTKE